jgi:histidinol dehydrogenase
MARPVEVYNLNDERERFRAFLQRGRALDIETQEIEKTARKIVSAVAAEGDAAFFRFTEEFDGVKLSAKSVRVAADEIAAAREGVSADFIGSAQRAAANIRRFHEKQRRGGYCLDDGNGVRLEKIVRPLARVGVYVPAGNAPLFSSLLMCAIPAQIAGVPEIALCVPPKADGSVDAHILACASLLGLGEIYRAGGAQAVAALAFGTESIRRVDKVVGPGNAYVTAAKKLVFGEVGIEGLAGPSEIVVVADETANPAWVAADMLSQAEHGSGYEAAVCLTDSAKTAGCVADEIERQIALLGEAGARARVALERFGLIFVARDLDEALDAANEIAPEHLELQVAEPRALLDRVRNAGAVFLGAASPEPVGDYWCGTNHVLPTGGTARFASSLGVADFLKDISVVEYTEARLAADGERIARLAEVEGLAAHAASVRARLARPARSRKGGAP